MEFPSLENHFRLVELLLHDGDHNWISQGRGEWNSLRIVKKSQLDGRKAPMDFSQAAWQVVLKKKMIISEIFRENIDKS